MSKQSAVQLYEHAILQLLSKKPFFARLLMTMQKTFTKEVPTLGVSVNSTGIKLAINPDFLELNPKYVATFLEHECLHIFYDHLGRRLKDENKRNLRLSNYAQDIAINQFLDDVPQVIKFRGEDGTVQDGKSATLENAREELKELSETPIELAPLLNFERYYAILAQHAPEIELTTFDDHQTGEQSDLTEEQQTQMVKRLAKAVKDTCSGNLSGTETKLLEEMLKSVVDWKGQLRNFFSNAEECITEDTRKRRNRRYGIQYPGVRHEPKLRVAVCMDSSGSVSDEAYAQFWAEMDRINSSGTISMVVIEADSEIKNVFEYKKRMKQVRTGYGGTAYGPALKKAEELGCDAVVYFGDMDCADTPAKPRIPVLWAIVGNQEPPVEWGRKLRIPIEG